LGSSPTSSENTICATHKGFIRAWHEWARLTAPQNFRLNRSEVEACDVADAEGEELRKYSIGEFIAASNYINGEAEQRIRSSLLSALDGGV
jgi:hypothetical protein